MIIIVIAAYVLDFITNLTGLEVIVGISGDDKEWWRRRYIERGEVNL
ncbi:MAG: hypothetical protein F7C36_02590 [Desulfurococcales archaeon]|nr:hypothetical protein [Desulfurococcales archaeon]